MFENETFENIIERMLDKVPDDYDKRENSMMWNALAPSAAEQARFYVFMDAVLNLVYADTSSGEWLSKRTAESGVDRKPAVKAQRQGLFYNEDSESFGVPIGSRFVVNDTYFKVIEQLENGFLIECETPGSIGNHLVGQMLPIENIQGLATAILGDVIVPGINEESDEALFARYVYEMNERPFGGNRADYKKKITSIEGVGGVKLFRTPSGGGTVGATIINSTFEVPSVELIERVQTEMDPVINQGDGIGMAPIGHRLTVSGVTKEVITIHSTLVLSSETSIGQIQSDVENAIGTYFSNLQEEWKDGESTDFLVVRISQIESRILTVKGVQDISGTLLNNIGTNVELSPTEIPELGVVTLNE